MRVGSNPIWRDLENLSKSDNRFFYAWYSKGGYEAKAFGEILFRGRV